MELFCNTNSRLTVHCQAPIAIASTLVKASFVFFMLEGQVKFFTESVGQTVALCGASGLSQAQLYTASVSQTLASIAHLKLSCFFFWSEQACALRRESNCCPIAQQLLQIRSNTQLQVLGVNWFCQYAGQWSRDVRHFNRARQIT